MDDKIIKEQIMFKITEIDRLFLEYKVIFERLKTCDPDLFDTTILASILHSFYNGIENIFSIIAKNIDKHVPNGNKSRQELLLQMLNSNNCRTTRVIDEKLYLKLREYATFRHFYRHAYSYQINWKKMQPLVIDIFEVWDNFKENLGSFLKIL